MSIVIISIIVVAVLLVGILLFVLLRNKSCPELTYKYGKDCVDVCPKQTYIQGNTCVDSCPTGKFINGNVCVDKCPDDKVVDGRVCKDNPSPTPPSPPAESKVPLSELSNSSIGFWIPQDKFKAFDGNWDTVYNPTSNDKFWMWFKNNDSSKLVTGYKIKFYTGKNGQPQTLKIFVNPDAKVTEDGANRLRNIEYTTSPLVTVPYTADETMKIVEDTFQAPVQADTLLVELSARTFVHEIEFYSQ